MSDYRLNNQLGFNQYQNPQQEDAMSNFLKYLELSDTGNTENPNPRDSNTKMDWGPVIAVLGQAALGAMNSRYQANRADETSAENRQWQSSESSLERAAQMERARLAAETSLKAAGASAGAQNKATQQRAWENATNAYMQAPRVTNDAIGNFLRALGR